MRFSEWQHLLVKKKIGHHIFPISLSQQFVGECDLEPLYISGHADFQIVPYTQINSSPRYQNCSLHYFLLRLFQASK